MRTRTGIILGLAATLVMVGMALAQSSTSFDIGWRYAGGSYQRSESANYAVMGTAGQSVTGRPVSQSAHYVVRSGYDQFAATATPTKTPVPTVTPTPTPVRVLLPALRR